MVKLAGEVTTDPDTGQLTTTFENNPQLPFADFKLHFFGGAGGALAPPTPAAATRPPLADPLVGGRPAPADAPTDGYAITSPRPAATARPARPTQPHAPAFDAGTIAPVAGNFSPAVVNLTPRGRLPEVLKTVTITPPPGLIGKLAGTPLVLRGAIAQATAATKTGDGARSKPTRAARPTPRSAPSTRRRERAPPPTTPRARPTSPAPTTAPR